MKMTIYNEPLWYKEWRDLGFECVNGPKAISLDIKQKNEHSQNSNKTVIAIHTGTGNSLYIAKQFKNAEIHFPAS